MAEPISSKATLACWQSICFRLSLVRSMLWKLPSAEICYRSSRNTFWLGLVAFFRPDWLPLAAEEEGMLGP